MRRGLRWLWAIVLIALLAGCRETQPPTEETPPGETALGQQVTAYLTEEGFHDAQLTRLEPLGDYPLYETSVRAYGLTFTWSGSPTPISDQYAFFEIAQDGQPVELLAVRDLRQSSLEAVALAVGWHIADVEYSISREGYPGHYGLGGYGLGLAGDTIPGYRDEVWPEAEPIHSEGSYYGIVTMEGLTYTYYFDASAAEADEFLARHIISLSTTRTDIKTYRGAYVGMSRDEALALYPQLREPPLWSFEGDYLWLGDEMGFGHLLLLHFEDNQIAQIELVNMMD